MNQTIKLDTRKREGKYGEARIAPLRRGERNNALLTVKVCANGQPYDLAGKTASLVATTAAGKLVGPCPMQVAEAGIARIMLPAALYSAVGAFNGYVEIREGETLVDTTDSFGGKVIECADIDAEQAAEFTPLLGELQNAVAEEAKRVEAEKARAQAETERATGFAEAKQAAHAATTAANDAATKAKSAADSASDAAKSANTAAGKATNAAAKAESDVRAFVNAAGTAVGDAIAAAREDVDAAVKRSDAATAKAEAAVETADSANTAANQAVGDARDAIAEVKATEAKLYPVAENILVGSETGTVAHVDDAFAGVSLRKITVEGAYKQDGIPSPESPKPIVVVENPAVKVCGRALFSLREVRGVEYVLVEYNNKRTFDKLVGEKVTVSLDFTTSVDLDGETSVYGYQNKGVGFNVDESRTIYSQVKTGKTYYYRYTDKLRQLGRDNTNHGSIIVYVMSEADRAKHPEIIVTNFKIEYGDTETPFAPYTEQAIAFALPAEHPYLAKLPDGTADEIVVDRDGNVELVARTYRQTLNDWNETSYKYFICRLDVPRVGNSGLSTIGDIADREIAGSIWCGSAMNFVAYTPSSNETVESMKALQIEVYAHVAEQRYSLGKIDMPKAQDSIVNVWTDAEVTPSTGIRYVRDVNIVVANIEKAIASITEG